MARKVASAFVRAAFVVFAATLLVVGGRASAGVVPDGMVRVPGGFFTMGAATLPGHLFSDEKPWPAKKPLDMDIRPFFLDRTEVTNGAYGQCVDAGACPPAKSLDKDNYNDPRQPVTGVTWEGARRYCEWRDKRLPREPEWELAARFGASGGDRAPLDDRAWHAGNAGDGPRAVATRAPDTLGLYDMLGNVWEWCDEWYTHPAVNWWPNLPLEFDRPELIVEGHYRALRGGSWHTDPRHVRPTLRLFWRPDRGVSQVGFRCAKDADE
ncbi:MAG: formylglycine-generating enzyme family protein [Candidatus Lernaella stagnicola]|nr:formylglycine-generating enzyme family protein [Candidatus Lernaella stagnicola]